MSHNKNKKIAVFSAKWHAPIVSSGEDSFIKDMVARGYSRDNIKVFKVPGALEIPLMGQKALEGDFDLAVGISFIVNGLIYRHEFVAQAVVDGIVNVGLKTGKPFLSVCLTPQAYSENAPENEEFFVKHFVKKGQEAAAAADEMLALTVA